MGALCPFLLTVDAAMLSDAGGYATLYKSVDTLYKIQ